MAKLPLGSVIKDRKRNLLFVVTSPAEKPVSTPSVPLVRGFASPLRDVREILITPEGVMAAWEVLL